SVFSGARTGAPRCPMTSGRSPDARSSRPAGDDDRAVVAELATGERAAVGKHGSGQRLRRQSGPLAQGRVEALGPVQLAAGPRLDDAVGVEHDGRARLELRADLLVHLAVVDAEREAARVECLDRSVLADEPRSRVTCTRARQPAGRIESEV